MAESVLSKLVDTDNDTKKEMSSMRKAVDKIANNQEKMLSMQETLAKRTAQNKKRDKADSPLKKMFEKEKKEAKKKGGLFGGIFDVIKKMLAGLGGIGILKALGIGAIGAAIAGYFGNKQFRDALNKHLFVPAWAAIKQGLIGPKGLFGSENQKKTWEWMKENPLKSLGLAVGGLAALIGPKSTLGLAFTVLGSTVKGLVGLMGPLATKLAGLVGGGVSSSVVAGGAGLVAAPLAIAAGAGLASNEIIKGRYGGGDAGEVGLDLYQEEMRIDASKKNKRGRQTEEFTKEEIERKKEIAEIRSELVRIKEERDKAKKEAVRYSGTGRSKRKKVDEEKVAAADAAYDEAFASLRQKYGFQTGGFVGRVPNQGGNGDRFNTMVESGSVVLNQTASGYQSGGMVPVMLEQGEKVFGPRDPNAGAALMMNSLIPRFQEGGEVKMIEHKKSRDYQAEAKAKKLKGAAVTPPPAASTSEEPAGGTFFSELGSTLSSMASAFSSFLGPIFKSMFGSMKSFAQSLGIGGGSSMGFGMLGQAFTPYSPFPASTAGGSSGGGGIPPEITKGSKGLLDFIAHYESGGSYNKIFGGAEIPGLTDMTIRQVVGVQKAHLRKGFESAAIGRYQMMYPDEYAKKAGLSLDDKFSEANQDKMGMVYLEEDGYSRFKSGQMSASQFANNVAGTWAALPMADGRSAHAGVGSNASLVGRNTYMQAIQASKMQNGGIAQVRRSDSVNNSSVMAKSQENFANMIAEKMSPVVIPMPMGGGGGQQSVIQNPGTQTAPPNLPDGPSTIQSAEYFYRLNMGSVF